MKIFIIIVDSCHGNKILSRKNNLENDYCINTTIHQTLHDLVANLSEEFDPSCLSKI